MPCPCSTDCDGWPAGTCSGRDFNMQLALARAAPPTRALQLMNIFMMSPSSPPAPLSCPSSTVPWACWAMACRFGSRSRLARYACRSILPSSGFSRSIACDHHRSGAVTPRPVPPHTGPRIAAASRTASSPRAHLEEQRAESAQGRVHGRRAEPLLPRPVKRLHELPGMHGHLAPLLLGLRRAGKLRSSRQHTCRTSRSASPDPTAHGAAPHSRTFAAASVCSTARAPNRSRSSARPSAAQSTRYSPSRLGSLAWMSSVETRLQPRQPSSGMSQSTSALRGRW